MLDHMPAVLKEALGKLLQVLGKNYISMNNSMVYCYCPVNNLFFLNKVLKCIATTRLQVVFYEVNNLDPLPSRCQPSLGTETALGILVRNIN